MSVEYTIIVTDKTFRLSKSQIEHDSPNFFTSYFLNSSDDNTTRLLEISRDPYLFTIILRYLNGYHILPLNPALLPPHCTPETVLADLRADAEFYRLNGLSALLSSVKTSGDQLATGYAEISGHYNTASDRLEPTDDLDKVADGFSFKSSSEQEYQTASQQDNYYTVPRNTKRGDPNVFYSGLLNERIVRRVLQRDGYTTSVTKWELLGWQRDYPDQHCRRSSIFVKLWTKPGPITNGRNDDSLA